MVVFFSSWGSLAGRGLGFQWRGVMGMGPEWWIFAGRRLGVRMGGLLVLQEGGGRARIGAGLGGVLDMVESFLLGGCVWCGVVEMCVLMNWEEVILHCSVSFLNCFCLHGREQFSARERTS